MTEAQRPTVLAHSKHLQLVSADGWEYVRRPNASGVVIVAALTTDGAVPLVEQYRVPVGARVIELPAGLSGDEPGQSDEPLERAARRELLEETGYEAPKWRRVFQGTSSAGLTDEMVTFFVALDASRVAEGGGVGGEDIVTRLVPLDSIDRWLEQRAADGLLIDARIHTGLHFLRREIE